MGSPKRVRWSGWLVVLYTCFCSCYEKETQRRAPFACPPAALPACMPRPNPCLPACLIAWFACNLARFVRACLLRLHPCLPSASLPAIIAWHPLLCLWGSQPLIHMQSTLAPYLLQHQAQGHPLLELLNPHPAQQTQQAHRVGTSLSTCALLDCLPPTSPLDGSLAHLEEPASVLLRVRTLLPCPEVMSSNSMSLSPMVSHAARTTKKKKKMKRRWCPAGTTFHCSSARRAPAACCLPTFGWHCCSRRSG